MVAPNCTQAEDMAINHVIQEGACKKAIGIDAEEGGMMLLVDN